jgi:hypothetical protein
MVKTDRTVVDRGDGLHRHGHLYDVQLLTTDMKHTEAAGPLLVNLIGSHACSGEHRLEPLALHARAVQPSAITYCQVYTS